MKSMVDVLVSVIIPVYNQERYLAEAVESVLAQTYQNFELILIDDGSVDDSPAIMGRYEHKDTRVSTVHIPNGGKPNAINLGVSLAKGELLAFMDHDDLMMPNRLELAVDYLATHPDVSATSSHCHYIDDRSEIIGAQRYKKLETAEATRVSIEAKEIIMCSFTALTVRKSAFLAVGGLRTAFWPSDDVDFINRLCQSGFLIVILQEILVKYRIHEASTTSREQWHLFNMSNYAGYCVKLRYEGEPEISFEAFTALRDKEGQWIKLRRYAHNYSILSLQKANFALSSKRYGKFLFYAIRAGIFDPRYTLENSRKRRNWGK